MFQETRIDTTNTTFVYHDLQPSTVYIVNIYPNRVGSVGNVDEKLRSSWIVQTMDDGQCTIYSSNSGRG